MDEKLIVMPAYYLLVLKKIMNTHLRHLEGIVRNLERLNVHPESKEDTELYFLQEQLEEAKIASKFLDLATSKESGWLKEVVSQVFPATNGKHK